MLDLGENSSCQLAWRAVLPYTAEHGAFKQNSYRKSFIIRSYFIP